MLDQKDEMLENNYDDFHERLATFLGLTKDELEEYGGNVADNTASDGTKIGNYIEFKKDTPAEVLNKIQNLDSSRTVYFNANELLKGD